MAETRSYLYGPDGSIVADEALAVRGAVVEVDDEGNVVRELESWEIERGPGRSLDAEIDDLMS